MKFTWDFMSRNSCLGFLSFLLKNDALFTSNHDTLWLFLGHSSYLNSLEGLPIFPHNRDSYSHCVPVYREELFCYPILGWTFCDDFWLDVL